MVKIITGETRSHLGNSQHTKSNLNSFRNSNFMRDGHQSLMLYYNTYLAIYVHRKLQVVPFCKNTISHLTRFCA